MRVAFWPFCSQQDKSTGKFLLHSDSGVKMYAYMAEQAVIAGWDADLLLPPPQQVSSWSELPCIARKVVHPYEVEVSNLRRRFQWVPSWIARVAEKYDIVCTTNEFIAYPMRCLDSGVGIVTECGFLRRVGFPQCADMFPLAWRAADRAHCHSEMLMRECREHVEPLLWKFGFDEDVLELPALERAVDVLFNTRASATGYTNHELFVDAMRESGLRVRMTDPTGYLENDGGCPEGWLVPTPDRESYLDLLRSSSVVVGLSDNGYGGFAFREAVAAGCTPVALCCEEYSWLGKDWPYYCSKAPASVLQAVQAAIREPKAARHLTADYAYSAAWLTAKKDLEDLHDDIRSGGARPRGQDYGVRSPKG